MGMVYSYLPFMILPLYASLEKFDTRLKEAAKDLGATPVADVLAGHVPPEHAWRDRGLHPGLHTVGRGVRHPAPARRVEDGDDGQPDTEPVRLQARDWAFGSALSVMLAALLLAAILFYVRRVGTDKLEGV